MPFGGKGRSHTNVDRSRIFDRYDDAGERVTPEQVDQFFKAQKSIPGSPTWRSSSRPSERRARFPVEVEGTLTGVELELVINLVRSDYLVIVLLVPSCITRLCLSGGHRNRVTREQIEGPHWHPWAANRPTGRSIKTNLPHAEPLPSSVRSRDEAFAWFLNEVGIDFPSWGPMPWPQDEGFL